MWFLCLLFFLLRDVQGATLSVPRSQLAATAVGNLVLFAGGRNGSNIADVVAQVDIYNASSDTWSTASLSQAREGIAATTVGHLALFAGGQFSLGYSTRVDIFNAVTNSWSTATLSQARRYITATSAGNLAFFGGDSTIVDIYNSATNSWSNASLSQSPYSNVAATGVLDLAIFGCGLNGQANIYNVTSNTWRSVSHTYVCAVAVTVGNLAIFSRFGYDVVDIYDASTDIWTTAPQPLNAFTLGVSAANVALMSGDSQAGLVYLYYPSSRHAHFVVFLHRANQSPNRICCSTWTPTRLSVPRNSMAAASVGNLVFFAGGNAPGGYSAQVDIYNVTSGTWNPPGCAPGHYLDPLATTVSCLPCSVGNFSATASWTCAFCPAGSFANATGSATCTLCPAGWSSSDGASNCSACPPGQAARSGGVCSACPPGSYAEQLGTPSCTLCLAGTASALPGATSASTCSVCGSGTFSAAGSPGCIACASGKTSVQGSSTCLDSVSSSSSSTNIAIAIVVVLGVIALTAAAFYFCMRRNMRVLSDVELALVGVENVQLCERLGGGHFGEVFRGVWNGTTQVALKKLKSKQDMHEFAREAAMLQSVNHPNTIRFLGIYTASSGEQYIVTEYLSLGSLDVLLAREKDSLQTTDLLAMVKHATAGMAYLEEKKIVHRDLALRNLLVAPGEGNERYLVKVSDFGLSRSTEQGEYRSLAREGQQPVPVRWCAPESLRDGVFTSKSDVWSFGVVLWEMFSFGRVPYPGVSTSEVLEKVLSGYQMPPPEHCPPEMYGLMTKCWNFHPDARPTFASLFDAIKRLHDISVFGSNPVPLPATFPLPSAYANCQK